MSTLLIADLHLAPERPRVNGQFLHFTSSIATGAQALYILGDLFEYWIGDDDLSDPLHCEIADALAALSSTGTRLYFMHGNRDVLVGKRFAERCGARLIADPTLVDLYGTRTLLLHGDTLCTDDLAYQNFRAYAHNPENQAKFLAQPAAARRLQMLGLRRDSESSKQEKSAAIMDVAPAAVESMLREYGYPRMIHGHTHRPAKHVHVVDGNECERWVLNDWYERGGYLRCDAKGCSAVLL
ncbi:MAG TPA: UDP-2,3-diacylglucosamine diphosphatase [Burkholderiales bacterium]